MLASCLSGRAKMPAQEGSPQVRKRLAFFQLENSDALLPCIYQRKKSPEKKEKQIENEEEANAETLTLRVACKNLVVPERGITGEIKGRTIKGTKGVVPNCICLVGVLDPATGRASYQARTELLKGLHPHFATPVTVALPEGHLIVLTLFHVFLHVEQASRHTSGNSKENTLRPRYKTLQMGDAVLQSHELIHPPP